VLDAKQQSVIATIRYGWENADFYARWAHGDRELGRQMHGVALAEGQAQSRLAPSALAIFQKTVFTPDYAERIQRHYRMHRDAIQSGDYPPVAETARRPSRNAPCACGSGRKYKGCCGRG
jgi:uncharacterized protein YecA (UPF0149 family)